MRKGKVEMGKEGKMEKVQEMEKRIIDKKGTKQVSDVVKERKMKIKRKLDTRKLELS